MCDTIDAALLHKLMQSPRQTITIDAALLQLMQSQADHSAKVSLSCGRGGKFCQWFSAGVYTIFFFFINLRCMFSLQYIFFFCIRFSLYPVYHFFFIFSHFPTQRETLSYLYSYSYFSVILCSVTLPPSTHFFNNTFHNLYSAVPLLP